MSQDASAEVDLPKRKSMLEKFELPLHHLDYDYVKKCKNVKELTKIIKVLRSKEEGYYPDLETCAESQLASLDNTNRLLRKETKVMTKADLSKDEWHNITTDLMDWKGGVEKKNSNIVDSKSRSLNCKLPNIRNSTKGSQMNKAIDNKYETTPRINSLDYKSWDKFDAEEECKKMDLEDEQKVEVEKRQQTSESKRKKDEESIEELAAQSLGNIDHLTKDEREVMAAREKNIGNEFYNNNEIDESIKHYSRSVQLYPTAIGFNNRAAAYLKQCGFSKALEDLNRALEMDPKNMKARFRRAQCLQHKNLFREALDDIQEVLLQQPNQILVRHVADQLRESVSRLPKMHKIKIQNKKTGKTEIKCVTEAEMLNNYKHEQFVEVNEWGLPKIMCNCDGKHSNDPGIRHELNMRYQHLKHSPNNIVATHGKPISVLNEEPPQSAASGSGKKLEIIEVESSAQEKTDEAAESLVSKKERNSRVVVDMRTTKTSSSLVENEKSQKTDENVHIKDASIPSSDRLAAVPLNTDGTKNEKTDQNITIQENRPVNGLIEPDLEPAVKNHLSCSCRDRFVRFQFKNEWKDLKSLENKAEHLKSICPPHLVQAFGNSWEKEMLVDVFKCLHHHFNKAEQRRAAEYIQAIPRLDRFNINIMFFSADEKQLVGEIVKKCSANVNSTTLAAFSSHLVLH